MFRIEAPQNGASSWLTEEVKDAYRQVWQAGLTGGCNLYRVTPLRPPTQADPGAAALALPMSMLSIDLPTLVVWGMKDIALPPELIDGLDAYIKNLTLIPVEDATHWIIHEQPQLVAGYLKAFLS